MREGSWDQHAYNSKGGMIGELFVISFVLDQKRVCKEKMGRGGTGTKLT